MSHYTTGEIAKKCGVTVRTVQYYDSRSILSPSALTDGGRRLYTEEDVKRLKIICFLRELGLSINTISQILNEERPENVVDLLLEQQEQVLREEIEQKQTQLDRLCELQKGLKTVSKFSVESIGDMALVMENKKKLNRLYCRMLVISIALEALEWTAIILWIIKGIWLPFAMWTVIAIPVIAWVVRCYYTSVKYICPQCHSTFRPAIREFFFARHTLRTRKLTCSCCGYKGFCVEAWGRDDPSSDK